jgi:hypothetical protein
MSDNRPTEWQWRPSRHGKVDELERGEWRRAGVSAWATRQKGRDGVSVVPAAAGNVFCDDWEHAPATWPEAMPALWPQMWQWRRLDQDMSQEMWRASPHWRSGGLEEVPELDGIWERGGPAMAKAGEWWAPADQDGNQCDWPEVDQQPVVVIPAEEMTPMLLYGHWARGGTWRYSFMDYVQTIGWRPNPATSQVSVGGHGLQWTPCDERGAFCELRRVWSDQDAEKASLDWERQYVEQDKVTQAVIAERDELKRRAMEAAAETEKVRVVASAAGAREVAVAVLSALNAYDDGVAYALRCAEGHGFAFVAAVLTENLKGIAKAWKGGWA